MNEKSQSFFRRIGPGPIVAAAFIGPGTITMCTSAGIGFGYALLWALLLSVIATISLQEMAARLAIVSQNDLAVVIKQLKAKPLVKWGVIGLVLSAIVIGNTAYEAGNISGGALGLTLFTGDLSIGINDLSLDLAPLVLGVGAFALMYFGSLKLLQRVLLSLVILMAFAFLLAAMITKPSFTDLLSGLFTFSMPEGSLLIIVGLIGTTVVPYNLFLHSSLVLKKWHSVEGLRDSRIDIFLSVILGGFVSICIVIAAASVNIDTLKTGADLALALEPVFGELAFYLIGLGLLAAGLTSAVTAPLAAAFVINGLFGNSSETKSRLYRTVWMLVLGFGTIAATLSIKPISLIKFAQVANGLFLPIIALILIYIMNKTSILGRYTNSLVQNAIAAMVFLISLALSYRILIGLL